MDAAYANGALIVDVRTPEEFTEEHVEGAVNIPYTAIGREIGKYTKDKGHKILLYCRIRKRAGIARKILKDLGYKNVANLGGCDDAMDLLE